VTLTRTLFLLLAVTASTIAAGVPAPYEHVRGIVWVVHDLDSSVSRLQAFGLIEVHRDGLNNVDENFRGAAISGNIQHASARLGAFAIDFVQPGSSEDAFSEFLKQHGDGIFALVSSVTNDDDLKNQVKKMKVAGVSILEQVSLGGTALTFFDTAAKGKYVLGLTKVPNLESASADPPVTHVGIDIQDPQPVSAYWQSLGWEPLKISHATPRADSRYRGQPLLLSFDVAWYKRHSLTIEWIIPPSRPPNCYADFLKEHGQGVQHLGMTVPDLDAAVARYQELGYSVWQSGAWGDVGKRNSGRYAYMDTDRVGGVAIEIIQTYN
jgi:glyoxalase/bleomycin resistance protein/dioxygenase superfamily protein